MPGRKPLTILDRTWQTWEPIGSTQMRILSDTTDDVRTWLPYLNETVEVTYANGDVEVWMVYSVHGREDGKLAVLLQFARC